MYKRRIKKKQIYRQPIYNFDLLKGVRLPLYSHTGSHRLVQLVGRSVDESIRYNFLIIQSVLCAIIVHLYWYFISYIGWRPQANFSEIEHSLSYSLFICTYLPDGTYVCVDFMSREKQCTCTIHIVLDHGHSITETKGLHVRIYMKNQNMYINLVIGVSKIGWNNNNHFKLRDIRLNAH